MCGKSNQSKTKSVCGKIKQHKVVCVTVSAAIFSTVLRVTISVIPNDVYLAIIVPSISITMIKLWPYAKPFIEKIQLLRSIGHQIREIAIRIDKRFTQWQEKWRQRIMNPNNFFEWLLPKVNVNISCAEYHPHSILSRYGHRSAFNECLEHEEYFNRFRTACFFELKNLPLRIEETLGEKYQKLRDEFVSIEVRRDGLYHQIQETSLIGWNIFGVMFKNPSSGVNNIDLAPEHAPFLRISVTPDAFLGRNIKNRILRGILHITEIGLYVRLRINKENISRADANDYFFACFDHQYECMTGRNFGINEPICALYYKQI